MHSFLFFSFLSFSYWVSWSKKNPCSGVCWHCSDPPRKTYSRILHDFLPRLQKNLRKSQRNLSPSTHWRQARSEAAPGFTSTLQTTTSNLKWTEITFQSGLLSIAVCLDLSLTFPYLHWTEMYLISPFQTWVMLYSCRFTMDLNYRPYFANGSVSMISTTVCACSFHLQIYLSCSLSSQGLEAWRSGFIPSNCTFLSLFFIPLDDSHHRRGC